MEELKESSSSSGVQALSEHELLQNILLSARNALGHSKAFNEHYVSHPFIFES